jgi:hypothetical protein
MLRAKRGALNARSAEISCPEMMQTYRTVSFLLRRTIGAFTAFYPLPFRSLDSERAL